MAEAEVTPERSRGKRRMEIYKDIWKSLVIPVIVALVLCVGHMAAAGEGAGEPRPGADALAQSQAKTLEDEFVRVAKSVGAAVVSISALHTQRVGGRRYLPFEDEFFNDFFREFFGELPEREFKQYGLGSGVIVEPSGYILTNEHVVADADELLVTLADGREFKGKIRGSDPRSDLAIIKIDTSGLPSAKFGDSDKVRIGQWAIAIGNPFGFAMSTPQPTVTVGVVSATNRSLPRTGRRDRDYSGLIQTDAAINPGNSGGPLVNINGEIIGMNVAIYSTSGGYQGIGFAIPSNTAKSVTSDLMKGKRVVYGWLGVNIQQTEEGILIAGLVVNAPASNAGLKEGDIIKSLNGEPAPDVGFFVNKIGHISVGSKVKLGILRAGKEMMFTVEIGERPGA